MAAPKMSEDDHAKVRELRGRGFTWRQIDTHLGRKPGSTLSSFHRNGWNNIGRDGRLNSGFAGLNVRSREEPGGDRSPEYVDPDFKNVPPQVWSERDRAFASAQSLTAMVCGDPPAGRSALDRTGRS